MTTLTLNNPLREPQLMPLLLFLLGLSAMLVGSTTLEMAQYEETRSLTQLQKVIVDPSGDVIVGGRNWLLRLDADLELQQSDRTGPLNSTGDLQGSSTAAEGGQQHLENNDASLLVRVPVAGRRKLLLSCGTARRGVCTVYSAGNLDHHEQLPSDNTLNLLGNAKSAVAFFGKGDLLMHKRSNPVTPGQALYVGASYDGRPMEYASKAVSARALLRTPDQRYNISYLYDVPRFNQTSATDIVASLKTSYLVDYIYGFEHEGFSYFLTVQKPLPYDSHGYVTHLVRVCQGDLHFNSYTEIQLYCRKMEYQPTHYDIARAAHLAEAGEQLSQKYGFKQGEQVLYVAFGWGRQGEDGNQAAPENGSSVCMYPMSTVREAFTKAQTDCYRGKAEWPSWIVTGGEHARCVAVKDILPINDSFCGRPENKAINGRYPLETVANITTRTLVTAINVVTYGSRTIAVLGTHNGSVLKVSINGNNPRPFATIDVAEGIAPEKAMVTDMALSMDKTMAYVLTGNRVTKVPIQSCSVHTDCAGCVMADDPLGCGWCEEQQKGSKCSASKECHGPWHEQSCPPVIHSFSPTTGPVEGGTRVEIIGDNFGTKNMPSHFPTVKVALSKCNVTSFNWTHITCVTDDRTIKFMSDIEVKVSDRQSEPPKPPVEGSCRSDPVIYSFESVRVDSFSPRFGPRSGGTILTITGENLHIGSSREVKVAYQPCAIKSVSPTQITCETSQWESEFKTHFGSSRARRRRSPKIDGPVEVRVDRAVKIVQNPPRFEYADDPIINHVYPQQSILSGGLKVTVRGENLNTVVRPRMMAKVVKEEEGGPSYEGECEVQQDGEVMICMTPSLEDRAKEISPSKPLSVDVYFLMDGVEKLRKFPTTHPELSRFTYYVDPVFKGFTNDGVKTFYLDQTVLEIWGEDLDLIDKVTDKITVVVGSKPCNVTQVGTTVLLCNPEKPPEGKDVDLTPLYPVTITTGNLHFDVGSLQFAKPGTSPVITYLVPCVVAVVVFILVIVALYYKRSLFKRRWSKLKALPNEPNVHYASGVHVDTAAQRADRANHSGDEHRLAHENSYWVNSLRNNMRHAASPPIVVVPDPVIDDEARRLIDDANLLISREHLLLLEVIGQGHFGCVYRGFMKFIGTKEEVEVAVKTLKSLTDTVHGQSYTNSVECRKFLEEALRMREFDHPNILRLIGIALDKEEMPLVVLPFMKHGDLLSYIRNEQNSPTVKQLMDFGIQIAEGMAYLATLKFVHRDLAARNCMLDDTMNVKVADFGLSRDIYERDYYSSDDPKAKLPVKWMAPESLEKGTYDTKTDVWSYGVVLWELMTRGVCPYPEVDNWDIIKFLKEGRRMPQPSYCPDALYSIMLQCWQSEPKLRLTFEELVHEVKGIILSMERAHEKVGLNVTYVNVSVTQPYLYPQNHDRGEATSAATAAAVVDGAYGGATSLPMHPVMGATGVSTISNGDPRATYASQGNGTLQHRHSYQANPHSRSTLV